MKFNKGVTLVLCLLVATMLVATAVAQETTAGLQGTVKDPQGAVVSKATVEISSPALIGTKKLLTDSSGYYRFANLPVGAYTITVTAAGFRTTKQSGIALEVGKLPSIDIALQVGGAEQTVEVSSEAPVIDVTQTHVQTNISQDEIANLPKGRSFQSVIQFAPAARNEPLQGNGGSGGYQIAGGANSENAYLIEGQETASIYDGTPHANTPFEFIQEVQVKTSGIDAEHSGALGGVVNAVQKRGSNGWHGSVWTSFEANPFDAGPRPYSVRYDPSQNGGVVDPTAQIYQPKQDSFHYVQPGFSIGGPFVKDRLWFFLSSAPELNTTRRTVNFNDPANNLGNQVFVQNDDTYFTTARVDAALNSKMRVFASWLYQYHRLQGSSLPNADSVQGYQNSSISSPVSTYEHGIGSNYPNQIFNTGLDYSITPTLVATTRYGYFFENQHDFGLPNSFVDSWRASGIGATDLQGNSLTNTPLGLPAGTITGPLQQLTGKNAFKHIQFSQDIAWFKGHMLGTHNFKFGYQLNHLYNDVNQHYNGPYVRLYPGKIFPPFGTTGQSNCAAITATNLALYGNSGGDSTQCRGLDGYMYLRDIATSGTVSSTNHGLYAQDSWTIGKGITINAGIRTDKEYLPVYSNLKGSYTGNPFDFSFGDKIAPRIGAAWDVMRNGKVKVFGSYGKFFDLMKLDVVTQSFGGAFWHNCYYALDTTDVASIIPTFGANGHYCSGPSTQGGNFQGGTTPAGVRFIENDDFRASAAEVVDPGLKPYQQHETTFGTDFQLAKNWAVEARWDRRRLDRAVEDAGFYDSTGTEQFAIVNPGFGTNASPASSTFACTGCPANPKAVRDYDGVEIRLSKSLSSHWFGQFSYTWSRLWGNYSGLTNTDLSDGGIGGRADPNNNRAFDESWFSFDSHGKYDNGPLATDRPNTFKAYAYYQMPWGHRNTTMIGLFQQLYQGSPLSTYADVGPGSGDPVYLEGRRNWVNATADPVTGAVTIGSIGPRRTNAFIQTDATFSHELKVNKNNESQVLSFAANITNLFNQSVATAYYSQFNSTNQGIQFRPPGTVNDPATYLLGYDWKSLVNSQGIVLSSLYGKPLYYQGNRTIRLKVAFNF
jgi:hypothetical protein